MKTMLFVSILLGLLLWACSSPPPTRTRSDEETETAPYLLLKTGETVPILLEAPESPAVQWYYQVSEDWVVSMIEPYDYPAKSGGAESTTTPMAGKKVFQVTGLKPGQVAIRFYQMNPVLGNQCNGVEMTYTVEVKTF